MAKTAANKTHDSNTDRRNGHGHIQSTETDFFEEFLSPTPGTRAIRGVLELVEHGLIDPWPEQPRTHITPTQVSEKRASIEAGHKAGKGIEGTGIEQPLIIRFHPDPDARQQGRFMLVDGELRWRSTQPAPGCDLPTQLPCLIRDLSEEESWEVAAVTGVQREEYSPLETARIIQRTMQGMNKERKQLSVREAAQRFGKSKSWLSDHLVIADPPEGASDDKRASIANLQWMVSERSDTLIHARELSKINNRDEQHQLTQRVVRDKLSLQALRNLINPTSEGKTESTSNQTSKSLKGKEIRTTKSTNGQDKPSSDPVRCHLQPANAFLAEAARLFEDGTPSYELRQSAKREIKQLEQLLNRLKKAMS